MNKKNMIILDEYKTYISLFKHIKNECDNYNSNRYIYNDTRNYNDKYEFNQLLNIHKNYMNNILNKINNYDIYMLFEKYEFNLDEINQSNNNILYNKPPSVKFMTDLMSYKRLEDYYICHDASICGNNSFTYFFQNGLLNNGLIKFLLNINYELYNEQTYINKYTTYLNNNNFLEQPAENNNNFYKYNILYKFLYDASIKEYNNNGYEKYIAHNKIFFIKNKEIKELLKKYYKINKDPTNKELTNDLAKFYEEININRDQKNNENFIIYNPQLPTIVLSHRWDGNIPLKDDSCAKLLNLLNMYDDNIYIFIDFLCMDQTKKFENKFLKNISYIFKNATRKIILIENIDTFVESMFCICDTLTFNKNDIILSNEPKIDRDFIINKIKDQKKFDYKIKWDTENDKKYEEVIDFFNIIIREYPNDYNLINTLIFVKNNINTYIKNEILKT